MKSISLCVCSDSGMSQSQDDSIVGTKQCRHSVAIMPIPGSLSSSSPDLLHPAASALDFSNPSGKNHTIGARVQPPGADIMTIDMSSYDAGAEGKQSWI